MPNDHRGITLVELIIAIAISTVILGAATLFLGMAHKNYNHASAQIDLQSESQILMEQIGMWVMEGNRVEVIVSAECVDLSDGATQIIFSLSGQQVKEKRDQALDLIEPAGMEEQDDTEQMDKMSVYYEQYQKTGYQNEQIAYTINKSGVLTGMEYNFDVKRPKVVIKGGEQKLEGEEEYAMGVKIKVLSYNQANIPKVIRKCAADAGYDR